MQSLGFFKIGLRAAFYDAALVGNMNAAMATGELRTTNRGGEKPVSRVTFQF